MIRDPLDRSHPLYPVWRQAVNSLISGHTVRSRALLARLIWGLRARGERDMGRPIVGYVCWIGYPISDHFMRNRGYGVSV